jgi:hypothetical protein
MFAMMSFVPYFSDSFLLGISKREVIFSFHFPKFYKTLLDLKPVKIFFALNLIFIYTSQILKNMIILNKIGEEKDERYYNNWKCYNGCICRM